VYPILSFDLADATFLVEGYMSGMSSTDLLVLRMRQDHYEPGELVLLRNSGEEMKLNRKTNPRYLGPYLLEGLKEDHMS
jgi:hypothetical protein